MAFNPGGGGSGGIAGASDVVLSNVQSNHFLGYDTATAKWKNKPVAVPTKVSNLTNDGDGSNPFAIISGATKIEVVASLPATPNANTLYFVVP